MEANDEHDSDEEDERQHEFHGKSVLLLQMENKKKMTEIDLKKIEIQILATKYLKSCF